MIRESLLKYKNLTEAIIINIKNDLDVEVLLEKRGKILVKLIEDITLDKKEIKDTYLELNIDELDKNLKEELQESKERIKKDIKEMNLRKNANQAYGNNINSVSIFNKKI